MSLTLNSELLFASCILVDLQWSSNHHAGVCCCSTVSAASPCSQVPWCRFRPIHTKKRECKVQKDFSFSLASNPYEFIVNNLIQCLSLSLPASNEEFHFTVIYHCEYPTMALRSNYFLFFVLGFPSSYFKFIYFIADIYSPFPLCSFYSCFNSSYF